MGDALSRTHVEHDDDRNLVNRDEFQAHGAHGGAIRSRDPAHSSDGLGMDDHGGRVRVDNHVACDLADTQDHGDSET